MSEVKRGLLIIVVVAVLMGAGGFAVGRVWSDGLNCPHHVSTPGKK